jgi:hypothetical protein
LIKKNFDLMKFQFSKGSFRKNYSTVFQEQLFFGMAKLQNLCLKTKVFLSPFLKFCLCCKNIQVLVQKSIKLLIFVGGSDFTD